MRNAKLARSAVLGLILAPLAAIADGYVIAHSSVNVAPGDVREIYVGNMQFAGSVKLVPVDNGAVQGDFLSKVIKTDPDRYATIWAKKGFRDGLNPPPVKSGDAEVMDFVKRTPGAIGYVSTNPGGANIIVKY
ncbi:phosphate ABC transporter substrate-binding protein [Azospira restricta]|nr:phosphate ABC transporter substrate-binding protein [Azospira restricta]